MLKETLKFLSTFQQQLKFTKIKYKAICPFVISYSSIHPFIYPSIYLSYIVSPGSTIGKGVLPPEVLLYNLDIIKDSYELHGSLVQTKAIRQSNVTLDNHRQGYTYYEGD